MDNLGAAPFTKEFYIHTYKNPEYLLFLEESKVKSYFRKKHHLHVIEAFKEKNIHLVLVPNLSRRETYQCLSRPNPFLYLDPKYIDSEDLNEVLSKQGRVVHYDDLQYPSFGQLYILFDVNNFENENIIKYYTIDRYFFQMKSYVHNFLIFLAQSFGADEIKWSLSSQVSTHDTNEVNVSAGSHGVTGEAGGTSGNDTENRMSSDLRLTYDNNGSEIFFETTTNERPWCVKIQKIINDSNVPYDVIKYWRNDKVMEKFLKNNRYFRYEFYKNNEFLVDFIRKRQNGMNSINHEVVFYDNHRTIFNYYNSLGVTHLAKIGLSFSHEHSSSTYNTTLYRVTFYDTEELEIKTLQTSIIEEKSISQLKEEGDTAISKIREKQSKWEQDNQKAMKYKYNYYNFMKKLQIRLFTQEDAKKKHEQDRLAKLKKHKKIPHKKPFHGNRNRAARHPSGGGLLGCGCSYESTKNVHDPQEYDPNRHVDYGDPHKLFVEGNVENEKQIDNIRAELDVKYNMYVILQKYNRYFHIQEKQLREKIGGIGSADFSLLETDSECGDGTGSEEEVRQAKQKRMEKHEQARIKQQKITFLKDLLHCFYTLIEDSNIDKNPDDHEKDEIQSFKMDTYVEKTPDEYLYIMVENIMNSIDIRKAMDEYLCDIRHLTRYIELPSSNSKKSGRKMDMFMECSFICESDYYQSLSKDKQARINKDILSVTKGYDKYDIQQKEIKQQKIEEETQDIEFIRVSNKPDGGNYASCDGCYVRDENYKVNGTPVFINEYKSRFIARSGSTWIITGTQWMEAIVEESMEKSNHSFGGFHASTNTSNSIITATWKDYEIFVSSASEVVKTYRHLCPSMSERALALSSSDESSDDIPKEESYGDNDTNEPEKSNTSAENDVNNEEKHNKRKGFMSLFESDSEKTNVGMNIDSLKEESGEDMNNIILTEEPEESDEEKQQDK
uniref:Uncharacterized protein n=1 Tax=viral metagenome TaxID=1070528 RepID=A0A6C0FBM5_9ZZZZ|tara:strand:- start:15740 stop:18592 length:2853 start_codon:yes stop_codon:yes gene_type:complete